MRFKILSLRLIMNIKTYPCYSKYHMHVVPCCTWYFRFGFQALKINYYDRGISPFLPDLLQTQLQGMGTISPK